MVIGDDIARVGDDDARARACLAACNFIEAALSPFLMLLNERCTILPILLESYCDDLMSSLGVFQKSTPLMLPYVNHDEM